MSRVLDLAGGCSAKARKKKNRETKKKKVVGMMFERLAKGSGSKSTTSTRGRSWVVFDVVEREEMFYNKADFRKARLRAFRCIACQVGEA